MEMKDSQMFPFLLTFWGSKGGGERFTVETINEITKIKPELLFFISVRMSVYEKLSTYAKSRVINLNPTIGYLDYLPFNLKRRKNRLRKLIGPDNSIKLIVNLMMHPTDTKFNNIWPKGTQKIQVIHDLRRHPGDLWPWTWLIRRNTRDVIAIALSKYIYDQIESGTKYLANFTRIENPPTIEPPEKLPAEYFLIAGRLKKYKNLSWLREINLESLPFPIVIAGKFKIDIPKHPKIFQINRWLKMQEMEYLISHAKALICTHSEASQSGLVQQAQSWKIPSIVNNKGAMPEQVSFGKRGIVLDSSNLVNSLELALQTITQMDFDFSDLGNKQLPTTAELLVMISEISA